MHTNDTQNGAPRRRLSDILTGGADSLRDQWQATEAAAEFAPLPAGTYIARIIAGELHNARSGTPGYQLTFRVLDGEYTGRQFWHQLWLTAAALPMAKRDLAKLGVTSIDQLEAPLPPGIRCEVKLALRRDDDGNERNRVRNFKVIGIDEDPTADDDFGPQTDPPPGSSPPSPAAHAATENADDDPPDFLAGTADAEPSTLVDATPTPPTRSALEGGR